MQQALQGTTPLDKLLEVETLLVQVVIHHGDKTIVVQDVDGNNVELPVAQYISLDLAGDNFKFHNELYNQILQEAVEHVEEEGFVAENYFANHPNPEISRIAGLPTGDQEVSTVSLQLKMSPVIQWVTECIRHCFCPLLEFLPIRSILTCAISLINSVCTHCTPFVVVSTKPKLCNALELMVVGNHFWNKMTVIVDDWHFSRMIVEKILRSSCIKQEVFVHKLLHVLLYFNCF